MNEDQKSTIDRRLDTSMITSIPFHTPPTQVNGINLDFENYDTDDLHREVQREAARI
jgi:hypothetical protein